MTRKDYEKWLNQESHRIAQANGMDKAKREYGTWLRRNDPIALEEGFQRWTKPTALDRHLEKFDMPQV